MASRRRRRKKNNGRLLLISAAGILLVGALIFTFIKPNEAEGGDSLTVSGGAPESDIAAQAGGTVPNRSEGEPEWESSEGERTDDELTDPLAAGDFTAFYYYEADKHSRYEAYAQANPELSADEVVWHVNAHLDKPFYEHTIALSGVYEKTIKGTFADGTSTRVSYITEDPIVVNKYYYLPEDFVPQNLVSLPSGREVTAETKMAFEALQEAAAAEGLSLRDGSAYRSINYQVEVYGRYTAKDPQDVVDTYSSRPGHSDHHTGEAIDLLARDGSLTNFGNDPESAWVAENAHRYGFIIRYPEGYDHITGYMYEPWHIRYVGVEVATFMKQNGIATLEEYKVKYIDHRQ